MLLGPLPLLIGTTKAFHHWDGKVYYAKNFWNKIDTDCVNTKASFLKTVPDIRSRPGDELSEVAKIRYVSKASH